MNSITFHGVIKIELASSDDSNGKCKSLWVTSTDYLGHEQDTKISFFGETDALLALPRSEDFTEHSEPEAAE
ncbi:hypothetical protein [Pseudohoeflea coraliihabitans]|uniref:Uncharacterized protein n=1 Tax=Pseudohoeflea coraliihabitans TaxID=2860393 RepID=A0ABS6WKK3_9HYPH|nr:hypothetical protein [Pseudohoeflea sp. DP4N28-3]MBW3095670.1 hypothetical protein [Pseudohoeflea sp. DP4N28-3]